MSVHYHTAIRWGLLFALLLFVPEAEPQTAPPEGLRKNTPTVHAFVNGRIITAPGKVIEKGSLVIREGIIEAVGKKVKIPEDARVWDLKGMSVYPGLIESYSEIGMPKKPKPEKRDEPQSRVTSHESPVRGASYWNPTVQAHHKGAELFMPDTSEAKKLRSQGFTTALAVPTNGIFKGTSVLVNLGEGKANELIVKSQVAHHIALERNREGYPNSLMGVIALVRQTFYDADWYRKAHEVFTRNPKLPRPETNEALASLVDAIEEKLPFIIETTDELSLLRADRIAQEFSLPLIVRGSGMEYRRLNAVRKTRRPILLPVNFPKPPTVETPEDAYQVTLREFRHWDAAPENPKRLKEAGILFAFTSQEEDPGTGSGKSEHKEGKVFLDRVRQIVKRGLSKEEVLRALTTNPAKLFGVEKRLGTLEVGKMANFVITEGDLFEEKSKIREVWIDGKRYEVEPIPEVDPRGEWVVNVRIGQEEEEWTLTLKKDLDWSEKASAFLLKGKIKKEKHEEKLKRALLTRSKLKFVFSGDSLGHPGVIRMTGIVESPEKGETLEIYGRGEWGDGSEFTWSATRKVPFKPEREPLDSLPDKMASFPTVYPQGAFGRTRIPDQPEVVVVKGATLWTCAPEGRIENGDLLIRKGKIVKVGKGLKVPKGAVLIDGKGKHLTPGIIDCHSHIAGTGGLNESGQAVSAEVRIGDVINGDDISIYRELAGGVTSANILHGSANPIGGQNQVIKLRWGGTPEELKFEGAPPGIKFALGENVKQSNWGERFTTRYPQTRMGVEEIMRDAFRAALDYEREWKGGGKGLPPRTDLELEAILEILKGKRLVHCHSYRQDEILMLMRLAEAFGFRIATFQHILEGYKVADVMAKHGAGGSTFSDWWAYKFEVYDAIPYNGVLMHGEGVVVSYNSDSSELARRLNLEAAKAVKYGGIIEEDALKFITLNPAKQLRIDHRVGSLESGKDADFVLWSGHPLSSYTFCEQTWIDGRRYFDREEDRKINENNQKERTHLIQKILTLEIEKKKKEKEEWKKEWELE
ncbi:amidohydrolase family protein [candidate division TA06 bacterium]|nr:amidohydrolase family protein [candidate division TA06 bacterium]